MRYRRIMARTTVNIDTDALVRVRELLGLQSTSETVNAALRETARRAQLDGFDATRDIELELSHAELRSWRDGRA